MTPFDVGTQLVALCKQGKNKEAMETLYSADVVSVEAIAMQGPAEIRGLEAIKAKSKWWSENHEVHSAQILGPFPHGDKFAVYFNYDVTQKTSGNRFHMEEVALYFVNHGKVVREEFYYKGM